MNKIESPKEEAAHYLRKISRICSDYLIQPHIEQGARQFAGMVLNHASQAGESLCAIITSTKEAKDAVTTYTAKCGLAEPDGDDVLVAMDEDHVDLINAAMKMASASGKVTDAIRNNVINGDKIDDYEMKSILGDCAQALCMLCSKLNIPLVDAIVCNFKELQEKHPDIFKP